MRTAVALALLALVLIAAPVAADPPTYALDLDNALLTRYCASVDPSGQGPPAYIDIERCVPF